MPVSRLCDGCGRNATITLTIDRPDEWVKVRMQRRAPYKGQPPTDDRYYHSMLCASRDLTRIAYSEGVGERYVTEAL